MSGLTVSGDGLAAYGTLRNAVTSRLKGVTPDFVDAEAAWALNEFLTRTQLVRATQDITLEEGEGSYALPLRTTHPYCLADTLYAGYLGNTQMAVGRDLNMWYATDEGTPSLIELEGVSRLRVHPRPDAENAGKTLRVLVSVTTDPSYRCAPIPDGIMPFVDTLLSGVLARLHAMDGVAWSNSTLAAYFSQRFHSQMMAARAAAMQGRSTTPAPLHFRRFGV